MKIVIKTTNLKLTQALKIFIEEKIGGLEKFSEIFNKKYFDNFFGKGKPGVEAWVEVGKTSFHHRKGYVFRAECQMRFPGESIRSAAKKKDLRMAIIEVKDELQRKLKKYGNKMSAIEKRRQGALKKKIRLSP